MSDQTVGNVGRFFNHSAKPNLFMQCVHTGTCPGVDEPQHGKYDDRMPKLAFFAMKDIPAMTEVRPSCPLARRLAVCRSCLCAWSQLTFDYGKSHAEQHKLHDNIAK